jgi:phage shock protein A
MQRAVGEVDGVIEEVRFDLGRLVAKKYRAEKRLAEANRQHSDLQRQIEAAVTAEQEGLAETSIARQLDIETQLPVLEAAIDDYGEREKELEGYIGALLAKRREMLAEWARRRESDTEAPMGAGETSARTPGDADPDIQGRLFKAESDFGRALESPSHLTGRQNDLGTASRLVELDEMVRKVEIEERLNQVRKKVKSAK